MKSAVVVSDLHIGSQYCRLDLFCTFLKNLPPNFALILNGDIIDSPTKKLNSAEREVLHRLVQESEKRSVVWVLGNHDDTLHLQDAGQILFVKDYSIDKRLFITHGHNFDNVMPHNRWFIILFKWLHSLRIKLGAKPVHVAYYAKKWPLLYRFLRRNVVRNAVEHARENDYESVACGHVHYPEDMIVNGIHYLNTGAWTESPTYCIYLNSEGAALMEVGDFMEKIGKI